jgi:hypothetical protein
VVSPSGGLGWITEGNFGGTSRNVIDIDAPIDVVFDVLLVVRNWWSLRRLKQIVEERVAAK